MPPNISRRVFIEWVPEKASEPTSTLVLTSSKRRFVDIRILISPDDKQSILPTWRLDWAFAGVSKTETHNGVHHSTWRHWIDSKTEDAESVVDEGDMLPDDEQGVALEKGRMVNPATGEMASYIEGWKDVEILPTAPERRPELTSGEHATLDSTSGKTASMHRLCIVLELCDEECSTRGMIVRVGQFVQGIIRVRELVALERWEWTENAGWIRETRIGDLPLPCPSVFDMGEAINEGVEVTKDGMIWKCVEWEEF